jgi:hypothetical protein
VLREIVDQVLHAGLHLRVSRHLNGEIDNRDAAGLPTGLALRGILVAHDLDSNLRDHSRDFRLQDTLPCSLVIIRCRPVRVLLFAKIPKNLSVDSFGSRNLQNLSESRGLAVDTQESVLFFGIFRILLDTLSAFAAICKWKAAANADSGKNPHPDLKGSRLGLP